MATIGTFQKSDDGFTGALKTLALSAKAKLTAVEKTDEKAPENAPHFRLFAGAVEIGAAWKKTSREGREYLSVKIDDPSFPAPVYASLVESEGGFNLIWSRRSGD